MNFVGLVELQLCRERTAQLASEAFQRPHFTRREERLGLCRVELAAGNDFPDSKIARLALELLVVLVHFAAAFRAADAQGRKVSRNGVAFVILCLTDEVPGHLDDFTHELLAFELAMLHLREFEFPFRCQFRREELGNAEAV